MLSKLCAAWLVVLVMLPFTAPFSTFSLADLTPGAGQRDGVAPSSPQHVAAATAAMGSHAAPIPRATSRLRLSFTQRCAPLVIVAPRAERAHRGVAVLCSSSTATRPAVLRI